MKLAVTAIAALSLLLVADATAQGGPRGPGRRGGMYDPKTVETVTGDVLRVERVGSGRGMRGGVHLVLKTDKEEIPVHLGPSWYLEHQEPKITSGDRVEVRGSRVTAHRKPAIVAAEVRKAGRVLKLRDEKGLPLWRGARRPGRRAPTGS